MTARSSMGSASPDAASSGSTPDTERALTDQAREHHQAYLAAHDALRLLQRAASDSTVALTAPAVQHAERVRTAAESINGATWNYWSNALHRAVVQAFDTVARYAVATFGRVDYLEIGSCQGVSMALVGSLLRHYGGLGSLISVDPYYEGGYFEINHLAIDKGTRDRAFRLYDRCGLDVRLIEAPSHEGLAQLVREGQRCHVVYIDGRHEGLHPATDFGLAQALLEDGGVTVLDDWRWPDVVPLKTLCDRHCEPLHETWKTAAYVKQTAR